MVTEVRKQKAAVPLCCCLSASSRAAMQVQEQRGPVPRLYFVAVVRCSFQIFVSADECGLFWSPPLQLE